MGSNANKLFREADAVFFDLDGCIYRGDRLCPGALQLVNRLRGEKKRIRFLTNNSTHTPDEVANKLVRFGMEATPAMCQTATEYVGHCVLETYGKSAVKIVGTASLAEMTAKAGHRVVPLDSNERADVVVIGRDTGFTYDKLQRVAAEVGRGALLVAANPDLFHPGRCGERVPETGALAAAVEAATGQTALYAGKPGAGFFRYAMAKDGLLPERCVMVGDNYSTDIVGGVGVGMRTIWLHGADGPGSGGGSAKPDVFARDMEQLYRQTASGG